MPASGLTTITTLGAALPLALKFLQHATSLTVRANLDTTVESSHVYHVEQRTDLHMGMRRVQIGFGKENWSFQWGYAADNTTFEIEKRQNDGSTIPLNSALLHNLHNLVPDQLLGYLHIGFRRLQP